LGLAVVGGLVVSQVLTLYFTPVYYLYLDKLRFRRRVRAGEPSSNGQDLLVTTEEPVRREPQPTHGAHAPAGAPTVQGLRR
jgi:hypothetical protein